MAWRQLNPNVTHDVPHFLNIAVPEIGSLDTVDNLCPGVRLKDLEQPESLPLIVAKWLAEAHIMDRNAGKVH